MNICLRQWGLVAALAVVGLVPSAALAQSSGDGFLFGTPRSTVTFSAGLDQPSGGSDLFTFVTKNLTVSRRDFRAAAWSVDVSYHFRPRLALLVSGGSATKTANSEFRDWVDNNRQSIRQATTFKRTPISATLKVYLTPQGRSIGRLAWIPNRIAVFAGGGGGVSSYRFGQEGDFIDFDTLKVFRDRFASSGWQPLVEGYVGADISLSLRFAMTTRLRHQWSSARLDTDFAGFDPIDLSSTSLTTGISFRY